MPWEELFIDISIIDCPVERYREVTSFLKIYCLSQVREGCGGRRIIYPDDSCDTLTSGADAGVHPYIFRPPREKIFLQVSDGASSAQAEPVFIMKQC